MNHVTLVGTVTHTGYKDTQHGPVLEVRIETKDRYKNAAGEVQEKNHVVEAALWGRLAELNQGVAEGSLVSIVGEVRGRLVQASNGGEFVNHSVVAKNFGILSGGRAASQQQGDQQRGPEQAPPPAPPADEFAADDIPF